jgi:hypothetical protein
MLVAAIVAAAAPFTGAPVAPVVVATYRAEVRSSSAVEKLTIRAPEDFRVRFVDPPAGLEIGRRGTEYIGASTGSDGSILRNLFPAAPDGGVRSVDRHGRLLDFVLAEARAGTLALTEAAIAGKSALRTTVDIPANDCAGLPPRRVTVFLARRTLLPLRVTERRRSTGKVLSVTTYAYSGLNAAVPVATFAPPPLGRRPFVTNLGFIRTSPPAASRPLPYVPRLPTVLPPGYSRAVSGWARRSGITGAEGSIPALPWLFAARYRRGQEHIDVTQRLARGGADWPDDPFGGECQPLRTERVTIGTVPGTYGTGQTVGPHLYWRDGPLLYTVSGPFPKDDLIAIAASLRRIDQ